LSKPSRGRCPAPPSRSNRSLQGSLVLTKKLDIVGDGPAAEVVVECSDASCVKMQTDVATRAA